MTESSNGERTVIVSAMSTDDTCPMSSPRHPFLDWDGRLPFAHRGGASDAPENTMQAFEYAIDLGYRYLETDVQVTSDGVLVAFHDNDLQRTCGRPGKISELPWSEVSKALVDGKAPIPLLEELLGAWPDARINIDCKSERRRRRADRLAAPDQLAAPGLCRGVQRRPVEAAAQGARHRAVQRRSGRSNSAMLRFGLLRNPPGLAAQVPVKEGPVTVVNRRLRRAIAPARPAGPRVDDRRCAPRWTGCSTSASTGS